MVSCELVCRELSNFMDGDIDPDLRTAIEDHLRQCHACAVLHDNTRNVLSIII